MTSSQNRVSAQTSFYNGLGGKQLNLVLLYLPLLNKSNLTCKTLKHKNNEMCNLPVFPLFPV